MISRMEGNMFRKKLSIVFLDFDIIPTPIFIF